MKVERDMVTEVTPACFVTEASTLGIKPGAMPPMLDTDMGNKLRLMQVRTREDGAAVYKQMLGCVILIVIND